MNIEHFDDLLRIAREQPEPQQLLLVFAGAELPDDASAAQRAGFAAGVGGALVPLMCVDKPAGALAGFAALCDEAAAAGPPWAIVFCAALPGRGTQPPSAADVDAALQRIVESIRSGRLQGLLPFNRDGEPVQLD